jgi:hypothetical protein
VVRRETARLLKVKAEFHNFGSQTNVGPRNRFNPLNAELNPICHLLALLGAHHILHVSRVRVNTSPRSKQTN